MKSIEIDETTKEKQSNRPFRSESKGTVTIEEEYATQIRTTTFPSKRSSLEGNNRSKRVSWMDEY
jgi:hypothetical protein